MNMPLWFSNLTFWSAQVASLVLASGFLPRLLQIRRPRVLLIYWRALLAISLLLPFVQPWHRAQSIGTITIAPGIATAIPISSPAVTHWHFPSGQIVAQIAGVVILAGIAVRFVVLTLGLLRLRQFRQASSPISTLDQSAAVLEEMSVLVNTRAEFRLSAEVDSPVTFGFTAPVILLPERFLSIQAQFQAAIACHELLHVRRHDWAHHLAEEILRALLWFHPAIAWVIVRVRLAREHVVDFEVVRLTKARKPYLEALLEFTTSRASIAAIPAPPFLAEHQLPERVALILKEVHMSQTRLIASLTGIACCLALAATLAVWTFPLKAAPRTEQNIDSGVTRGVLTDMTSGVASSARKIVVADLRIDGNVQDVEAVRARILKGLDGREFESNSRWLDEIAPLNIRGDFQRRGYFLVQVTNLKAQPLDTENQQHRMLVSFRVDEGEQFRAGNISIVNDKPARALVIPVEELRQQCPLRTGDLFNIDQIRDGLEGMRSLYSAQGYVDMTVEPDTSIDHETHSIATTMRVSEGNQYYVSSFDVRGLDSKTQDLLKAKMRPGDLFNWTLMMELYHQGKAILGAKVSARDVIHVERNVEARTADVLFDFSAGASRVN